MRHPRLSLLPLAVLLLASGPGQAHDRHLVEHAESAAPMAVSANAMIYAVEEDGSLRTLREGTNGWTCMSDNPTSPSFDPMCADASAIEWITAWMNKAEPPAGKMGFIYRLAPGFASNPTDPYAPDPYATGETENINWIFLEPHVAIVNAPDMLAGYPQEPGADASMPFVMWAGTPYGHLILPVE